MEEKTGKNEEWNIKARVLEFFRKTIICCCLEIISVAAIIIDTGYSTSTGQIGQNSILRSLIYFAILFFSIFYQLVYLLISISEQNKGINKEIREQRTMFGNSLGEKQCIPTREKEERCHQLIINKLDERSHFQYYTYDVTEVLKQKLENNSNISKLKIICYGRSGYGDIISHITRLRLNIDVEVIMYNTEKDAPIQREDDRRDINKHIKELKSRNKNVKVYVSNIPPMIRASALYVGDTAVWTTIQSYQLQYIENEKKIDNQKSITERLDIYRPDKSLIIICDETSSKKDFDGVTGYFNQEFERLKADSKEAIIDKNEVKYQVRANEK